MICYLDPCNESLPISSGTLVLHDPAIQSDVRVLIGYPAVAEIAYLLNERDVAGLELTLEKLKCTHYCKVGRVSVDSATIVVGDQASIESCPNSVLFLHTKNENQKIIQKLVSRFKLETRRLIDETAEVITEDPVEVYRLLSAYVASDLSLDPDDYLSYHPENGYWERCLEAAWDGGFFYACKNRLFVLSTGGDGSFDVVAGYSADRIIKIWLLLQDGLFQDGKVDYALKPLETRPPKKPPSPAFIAMMKEVLDVQKGYSTNIKKRPWWKIW